jgi:8-oxo-dGTP diphosphatase
MILSPVMTQSVDQNEKLAAGGVVFTLSDDGEQRVLIIHRPEYDDWSFPKGGVEPGESLEDAALREVREETGIECRIGQKIDISRYMYRTRKGNMKPKAVHYFLMEATSSHISVDGDEVDIAEWLSIDEARERLSHKADKEMLRHLAPDH